MTLQDLKNKLSNKYNNIQVNDSEYLSNEYIPTGLINLDKLIGGIPRRCFTEIAGESDIGKTTLLGKLVQSCQKRDLTCAYIATETKTSAKALKDRFQLDDFLFSMSCEGGEKTFELIVDLLSTGELDLILLDSLTNTMPARLSELDKNGDLTIRPGEHAKLVRSRLNIISPLCYEHNTALVWVNQYTSVINAMGRGPTKTTTGGKAPVYMAALRLDLSKSATGSKYTESSTGPQIGKNVDITAVKNHTGGPPGKVTEVCLDKTGFDPFISMQNYLTTNGLFEQKGRSYYPSEEIIEEFSFFEFEEKYVGKNKVVLMLKENPDLFENMYNYLMKK